MSPEEQAILLVRVDERVKVIHERLSTFASCAELEAVEKKIDNHILSRKEKRALIVASIGATGGLLGGAAAWIFRR